jgi:hypothetical protein
METKEYEQLSKKFSKKTSDIDDFIARMEKNPLVKKYRENLAITTPEAATAIMDRVIEAAHPGLIGRDLMPVVNVKEVTTKVPLAAVSVATEGARPLDYSAIDAGETESYTSVTVDREIGDKALWDPSILSMMPFDLVNRQVTELGRSCLQKETAVIIAVLDAVAAGDLAGGAEVTLAATLTWANIVSMVTQVQKVNFNPKILAMNPVEYADLLKLSEFTSSLYERVTEGSQGLYSRVLNVKILVSSLITAGTVYCIDTDVSGNLFVLQDLSIDNWSRGDIRRDGIIAYEFVHAQCLRKAGIARGKKPT